MEIKVQVTMTIEQARVMMHAMDFFTRIMMGQFEQLKYEFCFFGEEAEKFERRKEDREKLDIHLKWLKRFIYPQLSDNASWGITGDPCPENATMVYDIYKAMDYEISWHEHPNGGITVNFDKPMHWYKNQPLPDVRVFTK